MICNGYIRNQFPIFKLGRINNEANNKQSDGEKEEQEKRQKEKKERIEKGMENSVFMLFESERDYNV